VSGQRKQQSVAKSPPLAGVRVLEYAQYVAGPLCGVLLRDLGAEVIKIEPPTGDGYRYVMPVSTELGRFFVPLNRGKRSVLLDLKTEAGRARSARLIARADVVLHNYAPGRATAFGLDWDALHAKHPALVVGVVTSFGPTGPLAGAPAYDLVAQARSGLLTAHAGPGDTIPVRAGGIPLADLTAGHLLASSVLAALVAARTTGTGSVVDVSLLAAALAVQVQDLVWLEDEGSSDARVATPADLTARAMEISGDLAMNPYYRCYSTRTGFIAVACLNRAQREAFLGLFGLDDSTVAGPDIVPAEAGVLADKQRLTSEIERRISGEAASAWLDRLAAAGVPASPVLVRESVPGDEQVRSSGLVAEVEQPGLGRVRMLRSLVGGREPAPAPGLGADTEAVLEELA
jgi:crotonobetainyl-CoA:carnitine CoA-transferase CaiB-like acyl-CoA transferase